MKWKRERAGRYVSGDWIIEGEGTKWTLLCGEDKVGDAPSKKYLQKVAEDAERGEPTPKAKTKKTPPRRVPGKKTKLDLSLGDLPSVVEKGEGSVSLDSALRSIRLTLDGMAYSNNALAATMRQLAESNEAMAKSLRELLAFMKQMEAKKK